MCQGQGGWNRHEISVQSISFRLNVRLVLLAVMPTISLAAVIDMNWAGQGQSTSECVCAEWVRRDDTETESLGQGSFKYMERRSM